jgi:hypothetical protein
LQQLKSRNNQSLRQRRFCKSGGAIISFGTGKLMNLNQDPKSQQFFLDQIPEFNRLVPTITICRRLAFDRFIPHLRLTISGHVGVYPQSSELLSPSELFLVMIQPIPLYFWLVTPSTSSHREIPAREPHSKRPCPV